MKTNNLLTAEQARSLTPIMEKPMEYLMERITECAKKGLYFLELEGYLSNEMKEKFCELGYVVMEKKNSYGHFISWQPVMQTRF